MRRCSTQLLLALCLATFVIGCGPTKPGPISVELTCSPNPAHGDEQCTATVRVSNRGLDVQIDTVTAHVGIISGERAGESWDYAIPIVSRTVPKRSTEVVALEIGPAWGVAEQTRATISVTVESDGGVDTDELTMTFMPGRRLVEAASTGPRLLLGRGLLGVGLGQVFGQ